MLLNSLTKVTVLDWINAWALKSWTVAKMGIVRNLSIIIFKTMFEQRPRVQNVKY